LPEIENIANKHLGRALDGTIVKPYETPTEIDPSLLVAVPRVLNRTQYGIDENNLPFVGYDVWHCYEFSTLLDNGAPVTGVLKIVYSADSPNIVESKSLKLYLNSFNMVRMGKTYLDILDNVKQKIFGDLSECIGAPIRVSFFRRNIEKIENEFFQYKNIDDYAARLNITKYNEDPDILKVYDNLYYTRYNTPPVSFHSSLLRSNCRVTNQPDWGDVFISLNGEKLVTEESLLEYIISVRNENHFHEEICECIYKRLWDKLMPDYLVVACLYTRRGGIDINPIRSSVEMNFNLNDTYNLTYSTMRQ
jgi:7-cyano-7-deazaguanine reductase